MCGILFTASRAGHLTLSPDVIRTLKARGPDSLVTRHVPSFVADPERPDVDKWHLSFTSSVLSLRGHEIQHQPLVDDRTGSLLCWNGEAWRIKGRAVKGNDSRAVFDLLLRNLSEIGTSGEHLQLRFQAIVSALTSIAGPFAFVFFDSEAGVVYYGRDRLGRRSLLLNLKDDEARTNQPEEIVISSFDTTPTVLVAETSTAGIHCLDLNHAQPLLTTLPWPQAVRSINKAIPQRNIALADTPATETVDLLHRQILTSVQSRVLDVPTYNTTKTVDGRASRVAVLFSGGLDCTLLARICHDTLPVDEPIDLLNVAFENPRTVRAAATAASKRKSVSSMVSSPFENCPDRITGRASYQELTDQYGERRWRFVAVNVAYAEVMEHRSTIISLMRPHNTEMDLSIAMALYFAARGRGVAYVKLPDEKSYEYLSPARVLLSGLGADELFGGYTRHSAAFSRGGFDALNQELQLDFDRIGTRNLGRDDRVMAHWSREVRYPFLDEDFAAFALSLPAWEKVGFRPGKPIPKHFEGMPSAEVDKMENLDPAKMLLRCLTWQLGMKKAAAERKRAIQFGARTAKMEAGRTKGTDILQ